MLSLLFTHHFFHFDPQIELSRDLPLLIHGVAISVYKVNQSTTVTIDATTTGANGLDTGALAVSTWYYFYLIYNGTTVSGLLSTSSSAPTMGVSLIGSGSGRSTASP